jgi:hypothetical protein
VGPVPEILGLMSCFLSGQQSMIDPDVNCCAYVPPQN